MGRGVGRQLKRGGGGGGSERQEKGGEGVAGEGEEENKQTELSKGWEYNNITLELMEQSIQHRLGMDMIQLGQERIEKGRADKVFISCHLN